MLTFDDNYDDDDDDDDNSTTIVWRQNIECVSKRKSKRKYFVY